MKSDIKNSINSLLPLLERSIIESVNSVVKEKDPYGYALLIGEDLDQANIVLVTNSEKALEKCSEDEANDYRYIPDSWDDWHYEYFNEFNKNLNEIYSNFESTHEITDEECYYTSDGLEYMDILYSLYLQAMVNIKKEGKFKSIWYRIIWISDCDRSIIKKSFFKLNEGKVLTEAEYLFQDE